MQHPRFAYHLDRKQDRNDKWKSYSQGPSSAALFNRSTLITSNFEPKAPSWLRFLFLIFTRDAIIFSQASPHWLGKEIEEWVFYQC